MIDLIPLHLTSSCIERWHRGRCTCPACRAVSRPPRTVHEWVAIKKPLLQALSEELRHRNTLLFQVLRADAMPASRTPTSTLAHYRAIERMLDTRRRAVEQAVTLVPIARSEYHRMYVTFFQNRRKWLQLATLIEGYERDYREEDERVMKALRKEIVRLEREVEDVCDEEVAAAAAANADAQEEEEEGVQEASTLNLMDAPLAPLESPTSPESPTSLPPPPERPTFTSFFLSRFRLPTLGHKRRRYNCNHSSTVQRPPPQPPTLLESMRYNRRRRRILNGYKELRHLWSDMHSVTWELVKAMQLRRGP